MKSLTLPLIVNLNGTLSKSDGLIDAFLLTILKRPKLVPIVLAALFKSRYDFNVKLSEFGAFRPQSTPLRDNFISFLKQQHSEGREIHLISASPQNVVDAIATRVGIFATATGSKDGVNLKGASKAQYLQTRFADGFTYAGNDAGDLDVWRHARGIILVGVAKPVEKAACRLGVPIEARIADKPVLLSTWLRMLRIHQWSKNLLLFVPLALAHRYDDLVVMTNGAVAFACMGLVASATYIVNDLSDLDADRLHRTKKHRPLASAEISATSGAVCGLILGGLGFIGALLLDPWFAACLLAYIVLTLAYSIRLKAIALLDVFVLGLLYTLRIVMGTVLLRAAPSPWLLVFSLFFFFSLSMAKRHVEIIRALERGETGRISGRGYNVTDAPLSLSLGISSSSIAVMLLFLYVANDAYPAGAYRHPEWLWAISPLVFLWVIRVWLKSHRGKLDDDPINFALRDKPSLLLGSLVAICFCLATL